jgi:hypothetical protein
MLASKGGHVEAMKALLDRGAHLDLLDNVSSLGGRRHVGTDTEELRLYLPESGSPDVLHFILKTLSKL